ncbi:hypothetical protein [Roseibium sp.]|uniref:hypothetical protein n=1 Tax=Roseibium sp. TaxID=1936156 RepID=UPI00391DA141
MKMAFYAQSYDNESPDIVFIDNQKIPPQKEELRYSVLNKIGTVTANSTPTQHNGTINAYIHKEEIVLRIKTTTIDTSGRGTEIVYWGKRPIVGNTQWAQETQYGIRLFLSRIGRGIDTSTTDTLIDFLDKIQQPQEKTPSRNKKSSLMGSLLSIFSKNQHSSLSTNSIQVDRAPLNVKDTNTHSEPSLPSNKPSTGNLTADILASDPNCSSSLAYSVNDNGAQCAQIQPLSSQGCTHQFHRCPHEALQLELCYSDSECTNSSSSVQTLLNEYQVPKYNSHPTHSRSHDKSKILLPPTGEPQPLEVQQTPSKAEEKK